MSSPIMRAGATVYQLNDRGVNLWSFQVQPGFNDDGDRTSNEQCEFIASQMLLHAQENAIDEPNEYCLIIQTKIVRDEGGMYQHHEDVISHERSELGVDITTSTGTKIFYPWSFDGGIECIIEKDFYR